MGSALPLDLLIDITSSGVKDGFTIGKLNTIVIEKYNEALPNSRFNQASDLQTAQAIFGATSSVAKFAEVYFGVISKSGFITLLCMEPFVIMFVPAQQSYPPIHRAWYAEKPLRSLSGGTKSYTPANPAAIQIP